MSVAQKLIGLSRGFNPLSVAGLVAWYDGSDITTMWKDTARTSAVTADADIILGVTDKSGNGKHLSEATNGLSYKTGIQNGLSVMRADGTNDVLQNTSFVHSHTSTAFYVMKKRSVPAAGAQISVGYSANSIQLFTASGTSATDWLFFRNAAAATLVMTGATANAWGVVTCACASASSMVTYYNGAVTLAAFDPEDFNDKTIVSLGSSSAKANPIDADFAEVLIYNAALSATDRSRVTAYLGTKWAITVS